MKKTFFSLIVVIILAGSIIPLHSKAQTSTSANTSQISAELNLLSGTLTTLTNIESQRKSLVGGIRTQLLNITINLQRVTTMPMNSDAQKAAVQAELNLIRNSLNNLIPLTSASAQILQGEINILLIIRSRLLTLNSLL